MSCEYSTCERRGVVPASAGEDSEDLDVLGRKKLTLERYSGFSDKGPMKQFKWLEFCPPNENFEQDK